MGFFSVIALIMFAAIMFGFSDLSYWWLLVPMLAEGISVVVILGIAAAAAMKTGDLSFKDLRAALKSEKKEKKGIRL